MGFLKNLAPAAVLGAVGQAVGGPATSALGLFAGGQIGEMMGQEEANEQAQKNAQHQMDFQQAMSNTSHQRELLDLKAAGLNPILSANAGAATPAGASSVPQNVMGGMMSNAMQAANFMQQAKKNQAEIALMEAQKNKTNIDATVASKDVPRAQITNDVYNWLRDTWKGMTRENLIKNMNRQQNQYGPSQKTPQKLNQGSKP